jgi:hypothetical protein
VSLDHAGLRRELWTVLVASLLWGALPLLPAAARLQAADAEHPLTNALQLARSSREALKEVADYDATFTKRELMGRRLKSQEVYLKVREQPFSVYMLFRQPHAGREVLYVDGQNQGMLLAHEGGGVKSLVGTVSLAIDSPDAMEDSRHPITSIGLANLVDKVIEQWEAESKFGECEVKYYPNAKLGTTECKVIECSHPVPRNQFKFQMTRLYIDKQSNLPVRVEQYGFPGRGDKTPPLVEEYTYTNIRTNLGLSNKDFDPRNTAYAFD